MAIDLTQTHDLFTSDAAYRFPEATQLLTPALLIYPERVEANIEAMIRSRNVELCILSLIRVFDIIQPSKDI